MGQAKIKRRSFAEMLANGPGCIYCAGAAVADTIEHMPPISMFEGRQRPKGLEFPACAGCNGNTKHSDLVAALIANCWTNSSPARAGDIQRLLKGVSNNVRGLLEEMHLRKAGEKLARKRRNVPAQAHPMRADGPILTHHMFRFAAKFGFALHHEIFGAPIPKVGGVLARWFSNVEALNDEIPPVLFEILPSPVTLKQGVKSVGDQFQYSYARTEEGGHMLYFAAFNNSFAVTGITAVERSIYLQSRHQKPFQMFMPGDFAGPTTAA